MTDSILISIKKRLGIPEDYEAYDEDIIMDINSVLDIVTGQYGIGKKGFHIEDEDSEWEDLLEGREDVEFVKTFIYLKVRMMFDTPTSGPLIGAHEKLLSELEWRLSIMSEDGKL